MSSYEDYGTTSASYDATRVPIGVEILVGCFARSATPLSRMVVLDAGCGTGSYAAAVLPYVGAVHAVDVDPGMLAVARAKLAEAEAAGRVVFHQAGLTALPSPDAFFDAVMVNQVLHHLTAPEDALAELARVLKPGGSLVVNTCSQVQLVKGFWTSVLVPEATARMAERYLSLDALERAMGEVGLVPSGRFVPADATTQGEAYFDPRGPLDPAWRAGDSLWALARPEELRAAVTRIEALDAAGELETFRQRHDAERPDVGQITFVLATRPAVPDPPTTPA